MCGACGFNFDCLAITKTKYYPENLFRMNQHIPP
ncbi:BBE domain-containing protein [Azospirillum brasilense]|uniref:Berberine/berberine-like domain-containing protein n=1 Tax=Azospirillum brasilense TaxID=192 RepID=A0A235HDM8_AZOBR|nr:hypothetical protein CHT98_14030 [Azospirillum brasilense]